MSQRKWKKKKSKNTELEKSAICRFCTFCVRRIKHRSRTSALSSPMQDRIIIYCDFTRFRQVFFSNYYVIIGVVAIIITMFYPQNVREDVSSSVTSPTAYVITQWCITMTLMALWRRHWRSRKIQRDPTRSIGCYYYYYCCVGSVEDARR